jgi:hypothetical protein
MKLQDRTEPTNLESNMEEVGEDVYLQTESTDFEYDEEGIACATKGLNHDWEEFATGGWVREGQLLYEKRCIGSWNGGICNPLFVDHGFGTKLNCTDTEYYPAKGNPAWGCKRCRQAMCIQCKTYYVTNEKFQSPGRKSGVGNNRAKWINSMAEDDK